MARDLTICDHNELKIRDPQTGDEIALYYRTPLTDDRVGYQKALVVRVGNKIYTRVVEAKLKYGAEILTGIREGDFIVDGGPLSSIPETPGYREDWKDVVTATAGDLLMVLGGHVFEGAAIITTQPRLIVADGPLPPGITVDEEAAATADPEAGETAVPLD